MAKAQSYFILTFILIMAVNVRAQQDSAAPTLPHKLAPDTLINGGGSELMLDQSPTKRSPKKAALFSTVFPGGGQIYNHKYWKLPIVYGALATVGFFYFNNRFWYLEYKDAYLNDLDETKAPSVYALQGVSTTQLRTAADQSQQFMEYSMLAFAVLYGLQIVDATVDAHLFYFDVSEDLSMNWQPSLQMTTNQQFVQGLSLNFTF